MWHAILAISVSVWQIIVDASSPAMTKAARQNLRDAISGYILLKSASEPGLAQSLLISVATVFAEGFTVSRFAFRSRHHLET